MAFVDMAEAGNDAHDHGGDISHVADGLPGFFLIADVPVALRAFGRIVRIEGRVAEGTRLGLSDFGRWHV